MKPDERKVQLDDRFKAVLTDPRFEVSTGESRESSKEGERRLACSTSAIPAPLERITQVRTSGLGYLRQKEIPSNPNVECHAMVYFVSDGLLIRFSHRLEESQPKSKV